MKISMTKQILLETDVINTVSDFREICKSDKIISLKRTLFKNWSKLIPDNTNEGVEDKANQDQTAKNRINDVGNDARDETTIYVRAFEVDITRINSVRIYTNIKRVINREPEITWANRSLRIRCETEEEKKNYLQSPTSLGKESNSRNHTRR